MPSTGFALGVISYALLPLCSIAARPNCFQELLPALGSDGAQRHPPPWVEL